MALITFKALMIYSLYSGLRLIYVLYFES